MNSRNLTLVAVAVVLAVAVFVDGGFGEGTRAAFAVLAGLALVVATAGGLDTGAALRAPAVLALVALAALAIASAAWTIAEPAEALRWGLVIAGYAALAIAAAAVAGREGGVLALATLVAAVALAAALEGLVAFAIREKPLALHLAGEWQAAGPFEYPPALALAAVSALPLLLRAMFSSRISFAAAGAAGAATAALAVYVSGSRIGLGLLAAVAAMALVAPSPTLGTGRARAALGCAVALAIPAIAVLAADPADPASALDSDPSRLALIVAAVGLASAAWILVRAFTARAEMPGEEIGSESARARAPFLAALAVVVFAVVAFAASALTERSGQGVEGSGGTLHDREEHWRAAVETIGERPLAGAGAEAYYVASISEQGRDPVLYAHDLPLEATAELGIVGGLLVVAIYAGTIAAAWLVRATEAAWLLAPAAFAFLALNLVDWPWHLAGAGAIWAVALGGLTGAAGSARPRRGGPRPSKQPQRSAA